MKSAEPDDFRSEVKTENDRTIVKIYSDVDIASAGEFRAALDQATATAKPVVVDFSECAYLDSTGISTLVAAHNATSNVSVIASRHVAKILDLVGLTQLLNVEKASDPGAPA